MNGNNLKKLKKLNKQKKTASVICKVQYNKPNTNWTYRTKYT